MGALFGLVASFVLYTMPANLFTNWLCFARTPSSISNSSVMLRSPCSQRTPRVTPRRGIDQREVLMLPGDVSVATACRCSDDALAAYEQAPKTEEKDESPQWEGDEDVAAEMEGDYDEDDEGEDEEMGI